MFTLLVYIFCFTMSVSSAMYIHQCSVNQLVFHNCIVLTVEEQYETMVHILEENKILGDLFLSALILMGYHMSYLISSEIV